MATDKDDIETMNDGFVTLVADNKVGIMNLKNYVGPIPKDKALRLAAWLAVIADDTGHDFDDVLKAVKNT